MIKNKYKFANFIFFIFLVLIISRLFFLQVFKGSDYKKQSENRLVSSVTVKAPRGEILDRYGRPLVANSTGFLIQFEKTDISNDELNKTILALINMLDSKEEDYIDTFPIAPDLSDFLFTQYNDQEVREEKILKFKKDNGISENYDATKTFLEFVKKYDISDEYSDEEKRKIAGVRYEMASRNFSLSTPFTFATNVGIDIVTRLKEHSSAYKGVKIVTSPVRDYVYDGLASHILGRVGIIYREEYEKLKDQNYGMNDIIGKDGMEKYLESYLKGTDGRSSYVQTVGGTSNSLSSQKPVIPGNNAVLTIDLDIQKVAEESLKNRLLDIQQTTGYDRARAGSVVVMEVNTGEILAMASYPTFNLDTFDEDYNDLYNDPNKPMFNRAISGMYAPGSTFKMLTTFAALEENVITADDMIEDKGVYKYYDQSFNCWIWTENHTTHGNVNASMALRDSCNYYFYEVGKRLGDEKLTAYGKKVGLGTLTGIELEGESKGILANREYKEKTFDQQWFPGDTVQMAIGQSFNLFTPLQLANYTATIASRGTRYKSHILKNIREYDTGKIINESEIEILDTTQMSKSTYDVISSGMRMVSASEGTAGNIFGDFPVEVCSKTGSAQVSTGVANGIFVSYAPKDDPKVAIAIVVENAGSGNIIAPIAKDIYTEYFGLNNEYEKDLRYDKNTLLR